jgi:hypothetical protein
MLLAGGRVRRLLQSNFDALLGHVRTHAGEQLPA